MRDPDLQAKWPELRRQLDGLACEGEFGFDRQAREPQGGAGSCYAPASPA
jgi:hypothetical protein